MNAEDIARVSQSPEYLAWRDALVNGPVIPAADAMETRRLMVENRDANSAEGERNAIKKAQRTAAIIRSRRSF